MIKRGRRLRINKEMRDLVRENILTANDFIFPIFVVEGNNIKKEISSLPGNYHVSLDRLNEIVDEVVALNIKGVIIFGLPEHKDACGSEAYSDNGIVQKAIRKLREDYENLLVITDVCMCEYTSHGHCGIIEGKDVDNDKTLSFLDKIAVSHAKAGAHMVAPSDMMDGRILSIDRKSTCTSSNTTCGLVCAIIATEPGTSAAWPTISKESRNVAITPARNISWSSTTATRILAVSFSLIDVLPAPLSARSAYAF